jgi:spermidine/putrescine transport system permease protein
MAELARPRLRKPPLIVLPALGWFLWFLLVPLAIVVLYSFARKGTYGGIVYELGFANYARSGEWVYLRIFGASLRLAFVTALSCLLIGYPMAFVMATARASMRSVMLMLVVIPFWTNFVVRAYAIKLILAEHGPVNQALLALHLVAEPLVLTNSPLAIWIGMVTNYLPFMVLPLYVALEKFDFTLLEAARDLGARSWHLLFRILVPLTRAGIVSGLIFVFTPALGEFVIPDLLGGARTMLIGNVITDQFLKTRDWPFGAALSMLLILTVLGSLVLYLRSGEGMEQKA